MFLLLNFIFKAYLYFLPSKILCMFLAVLALIGSVVGSGFITGKEIAVFFGRNGVYGYLSCIVASICFFFLLRYFLVHSKKIKSLFFSSKLLLAISIILNVVLSSSMLAGVAQISAHWGKVTGFILVFLTIVLCFRVFKKGAKALDRLNLIFVPFMILSFLFVIIPKIQQFGAVKNGEIFSSLWFGLLYTILNISNMVILIISIGEKLLKKQKTQVALISSLAFGILLIVTVTVLIQNQSVLGLDMPLLALSHGWQKMLMSWLIFLGSITTLFSLVCSSSLHLRGLNINEMANFTITILLPTLISLLGFGFIVAYLYPLASILGLCLLLSTIFPKLFLNPFFKNSNKKIHSSRKHAKKHDAGHNDVKF